MDQWTAEVFAVATRLREAGTHDRVRDVTIVLPLEHFAVAAIELACQAQSEGDRSPAAAELNRLLARLAADPTAERFLVAVRSVVRRLGPAGEVARPTRSRHR